MTRRPSHEALRAVPLPQSGGSGCHRAAGQGSTPEAASNVDRCYWYRDGDDEILIPMCIGSAVKGPEQCTCDVPESTIERVTRERNAARAEVARLREKAERRLKQQLADWNRMKRPRARIDELEAAQRREENRA